MTPRSLACAVEEGSCPLLRQGSLWDVQVWGNRSVVQFSFEMVIVSMAVSAIYLTFVGPFDLGDRLKAYLWITGA